MPTRKKRGPVTLPEAAKELRMSPRALRDLCKAGRIGFVRAGHRNWLFTRAVDAGSLYL